MTATLTAPSPITTPPIVEPEQRLDLFGIGWARYVAITDAMGDRPGVKCLYLDGSLTLLTTSRKHDWFTVCLDVFIIAVANGLEIDWEPAGQATLRREEDDAGVEGDRTYHFGANAERMRGPQNIDLATQPPPDLAIEVEVSHSAKKSMLVYARLGVPEVWKFDADSLTPRFFRLVDGTYSEIPKSVTFPALLPADLPAQIASAEQLGTARWSRQLPVWVRDVLIPRLGNGA